MSVDQIDVLPERRDLQEAVQEIRAGPNHQPPTAGTQMAHQRGDDGETSAVHEAELGRIDLDTPCTLRHALSGHRLELGGGGHVDIALEYDDQPVTLGPGLNLE